MTKSAERIIEKYKAKKSLLTLKTRYYDIFEYRYGVTDGKFHTQLETGRKFGISANRIGQIEARVKYEIDNIT